MKFEVFEKAFIKSLKITLSNSVYNMCILVEKSQPWILEKENSMSKFFIMLISISIGLASTSIYAQKTLRLSPNETKTLKNSTLWTLNATCNVQSSTQVSGKIKIIVLKNNGKVNGKSLSTGQGTSITIKNNSSISVSTESGTQINLINLSDQELQAVCST
ncbi:Uncharacterised protein [Legionella pneumophila subsp. pascullei]|uniref:Uncharacterized protein n=2 Tax=Legionella pneumophila TaxID=446 RepID=A0AAX2IRQ2_LEGPN|nr:Uncharacterised protein [Legionella pneumophila subsp. pascullei]VEH03922.1 Uncharacterised protein [Legionella pneumophila subsp. pascullei]